MGWFKALWRRYCDFLDGLGLTPENRRCCVPLSERAQRAIREGGERAPVASERPRDEAGR
ncbi:hypothetical protein GCM10025772_01130 [Ferrimonas gelatinilytica]|uniref:Uncharacterized protein n=2 Tax=Ferrimonas gelatinilytica TaxID=1255257 RepID=A0ABP9RTE9_9GAMM